ncbi:uncharacterized protein LOC132854331 isoform X2 [Tachysurus vachellii]|uniref:uncharacterized protein LOC132854331 isoform X2 n=1 Tax=Tachysurus vachellii TaxID=175792 RepID=UPI00296AD5D3|nr:uncharacterized protein LOC132854331 isoform X2 [Tachysurus vachellii]
MQLCSLHHCVLFLLTFTTAPFSALEICPTRAKLHQPVTLSCTSKCSDSLIWNFLSNRDVVQAQCDQTSCKSEEGFSISHDHYLKGDSSLTITEADYSKRNVYACECEDSDFAYVRLVIETVFTPVQMKSDEDLKLKVSIPEPVEVIYKSGDAADEVICNVTKDSLQCKDDYRHRTSLTYPELTLKHMTPRDSGSYTIRDTKNDEDIQIYAVSVEAVLTPVQMKSDEDLKLKVSVPEPVEVIYKSGDSADEVICNVTKDSLQCKDDYRHRTSLTYPELTLRDMKPRDSGSYTIRDTKNNEDIQIYTVSVKAVFTPVQMKSDEDLKLKVSVPEPVEVIYKSGDSADEVICNVTKDSLQCKDEYRHRTSLTYPELTLRDMKPRDSGSYTIRDTKNNEDIQIYTVSVEAVFTPVQMKSDEDLKLKVSVPEPVEVIYKSGDAADEVICNVTKDSLQCKDDYRHRTSLTYPELTLRDMKPRDSGSYTIRDTKNNEDIQIYAVSVEAVFTPVQMKYEEDLKLKVSVPEPVEVIYKSGDSADEVICNVTKNSLQCKDDYRHRTSLTYPELTLRDMKPRDSGSYTIRDTKNNEDIQIYAVSVEEKPGFPAFGIVLILILLCCCVGAGIFLLYKHCMRKQLKWRLQQVDQLVQEALEGTEKKIREEEKSVDQLQMSGRRLQLLKGTGTGGTEEKIREVEKSLDQLQQQYNNTVYKDKVKVFCSDKRIQLLERRQQLVDQLVQEVDQLVQEAEGTEEKIREVEKSLDQLQQQYNNTEYKHKVKVFCSDKREQLLKWRQQLVDQLVQKAAGGTEEKIREVEKSLDQLQQQYNTEYNHKVEVFCSAKRRQLLKWRQQLVDQLVQKAAGGTEEKNREVEKSLDQLQQQYNNTDYKDTVKVFCSEKRIQLLNSQLLTLVQPLKKNEEWKKEDIERLERELNQMMYLYRKSEHLNDVFLLCMEHRSQISWNRLQYSQEEPFKTKRSEDTQRTNLKQLPVQVGFIVSDYCLVMFSSLSPSGGESSSVHSLGHVSASCP